MGYRTALRLTEARGGRTPLAMGNAPFFVDTEVITLSRNGVWLSDGVEIDHDETRRAFARALTRDAQGWVLRIGREEKRITVEDTPYFVTRIDGSAERGYEVTLNDETRERLDAGTLAYRPGRLSCRVKGGEEEAKFLSAPYFDLLRGLEEDEAGYFVRIEGTARRLAGRAK
jgi:hypothetical protein